MCTLNILTNWYLFLCCSILSEAIKTRYLPIEWLEWLYCQWVIEIWIMNTMMLHTSQFRALSCYFIHICIWQVIWYFLIGWLNSVLSILYLLECKCISSFGIYIIKKHMNFQIPINQHSRMIINVSWTVFWT